MVFMSRKAITAKLYLGVRFGDKIVDSLRPPLARISQAVPLYGWIWDKYQPHTSFMTSYDPMEIREIGYEGWKRASVGFAGPYAQLIFMIVVGVCVTPNVTRVACGDLKSYVILMLGWTLVYLYAYSIWFFEDANSDFALMVRKAHPS